LHLKSAADEIYTNLVMFIGSDVMRWMSPALFMLTISVSEALAQGYGKGGKGGPHGPHAAPEIDGPAGIAAIAVLVGAGLIAYNRYRNK
jgi:hypothetical protein